eukprot:848734-Lingulodinium_polyedra.AAC.1
MRAPVSGARVERATVWFATRCGSGRSIRARRCAAVHKRCTMARSNQRFVVAAVRELHARALYVRQFMLRARECAMCELLWQHMVDSTASLRS